MQSIPAHEFFTNRGTHLKQAKKDGIIFIENGSSPSNSFFVVFPKFLLDHVKNGDLVNSIVKVTEAIKAKVSEKYRKMRLGR